MRKFKWVKKNKEMNLYHKKADDVMRRKTKVYI